MGGSSDRVTLLPFDVYDPQTPVHGRQRSISQSLLRQRVAAFDAARASCTYEADKDQLIAIIAAGFGGLARFNEAVRSILGDVSSAAFVFVQHSTNAAVAPVPAVVPVPAARAPAAGQAETLPHTRPAARSSFPQGILRHLAPAELMPWSNARQATSCQASASASIEVV